MRKSEVIHIRAEPSQKEIIRLLAKSSGQSVSKFMLQASTKDVQLKTVFDYETLKELANER